MKMRHPDEFHCADCWLSYLIALASATIETNFDLIKKNNGTKITEDLHTAFKNYAIHLFKDKARH